MVLAALVAMERCMGLTVLGLLPASQTPSLGVMMKPEVANGNETDVQSGVQA